QAKKNQAFYKLRSEQSRRFCGVLLKATVRVVPKFGGGGEILIDWGVEYTRARPPPLILGPSPEAQNGGKAASIHFAEGKDQRIYEFDLESPTPQIVSGLFGRYLTVEKGKTVTGKLTVSARKLANHFAGRWPNQFGEKPPVVHVQLWHKPYQRGNDD